MALVDFPIGAIIAWGNAAIPSGWVVCDGIGVPDLRDRFIMGASINSDVRLTGGASSHGHVSPSTNNRNQHNHGGSRALGSLGSSSGTGASSTGTGYYYANSGHTHGGNPSINLGYADTHSHTTPNTNSVSNSPPHVCRVFIERVA